MKSSTWTWVKGEARICLDNIELFNSFICSIPEGYRGQMILQDIPKPKSKKQNSTYWHVIDQIVHEFEDIGIDSSYIYGGTASGVPVTKGMLHEWFYVLFPTVNDKGKTIRMSDSEWTSKDEAKMIDNVLNFTASTFGIVVNINER